MVSEGIQKNSANHHTLLLLLPNEIIATITKLLSNKDLKNLRLASSRLHDMCTLRIERVFISPNRKNVDVFNAIAAHEILRKRVTEIVWDDARFIGKSPNPEDNDKVHHRGCTKWFVRGCRETLIGLRPYQQKQHAKLLRSRMPIPDSYACYMDFYYQQEDIIASGEDIEAFRNGLARFPGLQRITLTPVAHRQFLNPRYPTPMIRLFIPGVIYPLPETWPTNSAGSAEIKPWDSDQEKQKWRGFCAITRALASVPHNVTEFIIDVNRSDTGLSCNVFVETSQEYEDTKALFAKKNLRRIDLALSVAGDAHVNGWQCYRSGLLEKALAQAHDLEHFYFHTNIDFDSTIPAAHLVPLLEVFPATKWPKLSHFGLSCFLVTVGDLISFLRLLPPTLKSIELSRLEFIGGSYAELLKRMRDELHWDEGGRCPKVTISVRNFLGYPGLSDWVTDEVDAFLYHGGPNPFTEEYPHDIAPGVGVERQDFDESYTRPHLGKRPQLGLSGTSEN